jgi:hypothetical protein
MYEGTGLVPFYFAYYKNKNALIYQGIFYMFNCVYRISIASP